MATPTIQFPAPSGLTITAYLRKYGTSTFFNASGHSATEVTIDGLGTGDYTITVTNPDSAWYRLYLFTDTNPNSAFASYDVYIQNDGGTYLAGDINQQLVFDSTDLSLSPLSGNLILNSSAYLEPLDYTNLTTGEQALVDALITAASDYIQNQLLNRQILANDYVGEKHDGNGWDSIFIKNPPINSLTSISLITYNAVTGDTETTSYASSKFTTKGDTGEIRFKPDVLLDTAKIFPEGFQNVSITYNGGFSSVPQPLQMLTADFVIQMYNEDELQGVLEREKIGDYSYSKGNDWWKRLPFSKRKILTSYKIRRV